MKNLQEKIIKELFLLIFICDGYNDLCLVRGLNKNIVVLWKIMIDIKIILLKKLILNLNFYWIWEFLENGLIV